MRDRQCALNHDAISRFHCLRCVINKPTTDDLWISPVYQRLAVAKFSKSTMYKLPAWPWPRPLREHSLITRLRLRTTDPCTKFEVSSVRRCRDITWGVKFYKGLPDPDHAPFREDFSPAGWDLLWYNSVPNVKSLGSPVTTLWMALQNAENGVVWGS